jgi:hypothetical protein
VRLLSYSSACSRGHRGPSLRGAAEAPLLALLGLGLFCWIFLTNSLPAKRDLAGRIAKVERYAGPGGRIEGLRRELAEEEALARAVREDPVVRRALFLLEHPTAPENAPEHLLTVFAQGELPEEPETLVAPDAEESYADLLDGSLDGAAAGAQLPGDSPSRVGGPADGAEGREERDDSAGVNRPSDARPEVDSIAARASRTNMPSGRREERAEPAEPRSSSARRMDPLLDARGRVAPPAGRRAGGADAGTSGASGSPKAPAAGGPKPRAPKPANGKTSAGNAAAPRPTGSFDVPSFLRG